MNKKSKHKPKHNTPKAAAVKVVKPAEALPAKKDVQPPAAPGKKLKYYDITPETDIKYRGILSYRHLKIIAWLFIVLAFGGTVLSIYAQITETESKYSFTVSALQFGKMFSVPLLLFAGYSTVLNGRGNFKKLLMTNTAVSLALAGLFIFVYERYLIRACAAMTGDRRSGLEMIDSMLSSSTSSGFFSFNIFIDLTLCTLVMFFLNYEPKKYFQGKKIHFFRALVLLPIAYEIVSICLKILASTHSLTLPVYVFPFLTTKPPAGFLLFIIIAKYFRETEYQFRKHGKTHEEYEAYLTTNHNSFRFAKFTSLAIFIVALIDLIIATAIILMHCAATGGIQDLSEERLSDATKVVTSWGFGETIPMVTIIPVILLFSYTRTHKNKLIDIAVPLISIVLIVFIGFDGLFSMICEILKETSAQ